MEFETLSNAMHYVVFNLKMDGSLTQRRKKQRGYCQGKQTIQHIKVMFSYLL